VRLKGILSSVLYKWCHKNKFNIMAMMMTMMMMMMMTLQCLKVCVFNRRKLLK